MELTILNEIEETKRLIDENITKRLKDVILNYNDKLINSFLEINGAEIALKIKNLFEVFDETYIGLIFVSDCLNNVNYQIIKKNITNYNDMRNQIVQIGEQWENVTNAINELVIDNLECGLYKLELQQRVVSIISIIKKIVQGLSEIKVYVERAYDKKVVNQCSNVRCLLNGEHCNKNILNSENIVFIGYQFNSEYYNRDSFKQNMTEALYNFKLIPFFPDDHFETVHIICEICHKLQEVNICIFEISDSNPNVMFELGMAYILGKEIIILSKNGSKGTKISDIAGLHRIQYEDLTLCKNLLRNLLQSSDTISALLKEMGAEND